MPVKDAPLTSRRSDSGHLTASLSAPRRLQETSKLSFFGSRSLQERSKRLPRGFLRASASKMRFGSHFDTFLTSKRGPWTSKTKEILCTVDGFSGFTIFSLIRFWNQFKDPPGTLLGAHLALRQCETSLLGALGPAKSRSQQCFLGPEGLQEASKSAPYAPGSLHLADQASSRAPKRPPRALQEASRAHLAAILASFCINFETISMLCCPHVGHASSLKAPSSEIPWEICWETSHPTGLPDSPTSFWPMSPPQRSLHIQMRPRRVDKNLRDPRTR